MKKKQERRSDVFCRFHPIVNLIYFVFVLGFSMVFRHPVYQLISLVTALIYSGRCEGPKALLFSLKYALPLILLTSLLNPTFNHQGVTILCYLPWGNPLTLESIGYGVSSGVMFASVLIWFMCFNRVFTTDKLIYLFGIRMPSFSLLLSMTLRFIPKFQEQTQEVKEAQRCLGMDTENTSRLRRLKNALSVYSVVVTRSLENAVETSDSMKSRGYGTGKRTAYSVYRFSLRDRDTLLVILFLGIFILCGALAGGTAFTYYPSIRFAVFSPINILLQLSFLSLCLVPVILNRREDAEWNAIQSKM